MCISCKSSMLLNPNLYLSLFSFDPPPDSAGEMHFPYEWAPYIVEIQILRAGQFIILAVPGELTTMAGRRLVAAVRDVIEDSWGPEVHIVIAGLSNTYSSYVTTWEEYQVQRYEGGFTLFGPHTLDAYIQEFRSLASAMVDGV